MCFGHCWYLILLPSMWFHHELDPAPLARPRYFQISLLFPSIKLLLPLGTVITSLSLPQDHEFFDGVFDPYIPRALPKA